MPFTVRDLLVDRPEPDTVTLDSAVRAALEVMIENDYSQLPVVDQAGRPLGMITSDSIIRALSHFGVTIDKLRVSHVVVKARNFHDEDDLFDLLDTLRDTYAALIVSGDGRLTGIVTSYDTTEYFRRRAEDMMYVEDIETTIKEHIRTSFTSDSGDVDDAALSSRVAEVASGKQELRQKLRAALNHYLSLTGHPGLNDESLGVVFERHFSLGDPDKSFDDLTLNEYIQLLLHKESWPHFREVFALEPQAIRNTLEPVRKIRNQLAHFRGEITSKQRDQLHFCAGWLTFHQPAIPLTIPQRTADRNVADRVPISPAPVSATAQVNPLSVTVSVHDASAVSIDERATVVEMPGPPAEEVVAPSESRYARLAVYLQSLPQQQERAALTFEQIEALIGGPLPASARRHRAWWANDSVAHTHSRLWLDVGWRVGIVNMTEERVMFIRIQGRQRAYIDFFGPLFNRLRAANAFPFWNVSPDGSSWMQIGGIRSEGRPVARFGFAFTRDRRFRIDLMIDTEEDQAINKRIYDGLYARRYEIEAEIGEPLSWERMDNARASRIALYHDGFITDPAEALEALQRWAVEAMIRFQRVITDHVNQLLEAGILRMERSEVGA